MAPVSSCADVISTPTWRSASRRCFLNLLATMALVVAALPAFAGETETIPADEIDIGEAQIAEFQGTDMGDPDTTPLDLTVVSAVFGGPKRIAPPGAVTTDTGYTVNFSSDFTLVEGAGTANNFFPTSVDPNTSTTRLPTDLSVLEDCWVYAFVLINDDGLETVPGLEGPGGATLNFFGISLDPTLVRLPAQDGIPGAFIDAAGTRGAYIYAYGQTDFPGFVHYNDITGSQGNVTLRCESGVMPIPESMAPGEAAARAQVVFYYSPFAPSVFNTTVSGSSGESISDNLATVFPGASYWPHFSCDVPEQPEDLEPGEVAEVDVNITSEARTYYTRDLLSMPDGSSPELFATLAYTDDPDPDCDGAITIEGMALCGDAFATTTAITACVPFEGSTCVRVQVEANGDACSNFEGCEFPVELVSSITAESPYNVDPPFEGVVFPNPKPPAGGDFLDADPDGDDLGELCPIMVGIECPCIQSIEKRFKYLPDGGPGVDCDIDNGVDPETAPTCARVKVIIEVTAEQASDPMTITALKDELPNFTSFCEGTIESFPAGVTGVYNGGANEINFNVPGSISLMTGETLTVCYEMRVSPAAAGGAAVGAGRNACSTAECGGVPADPPTAIDDAVLNIKKPEISVTAPGGAAPALCLDPSGNMATLTFTVSNTSNALNGWPLDPVNVAATSTCANLDIISITPGGGGANIGPIAPGGSVNVDVKVTLNGVCNPVEMICLQATGLPEGVDDSNDCGIDGGQCDFMDEACANVETVAPAITVECAPSNTTPGLGEIVDFEIKVTNTGNVPLENLTLSGCVADDGLVIVPPPAAFPGGQLAPGAMAVAVVKARVDALLPILCIRDCVIDADVVGADDACFDAVELPPCCVTTVEIPTLSEWGLILMVLALGSVVILRMRRLG